MCSESVERATAISLEGAGKVFHRYHRPLDRLMLQLPGLARFSRHDTITGLHPVDLNVKRGEVVGLVGRNGAGKSTLLQLVCNTLLPSCGEVTVNGRIAALLELGSGFNPEFTGRENVYMSAAIAGLSRAQIEARFDEIVAFSGIGDFIEQPVKTYSSGMFVRLAFAVATSVDPDILVIDEALSVGDGAFARQSFDRIMALRDRGATILFCSHSLYQVDVLCERALWVERGRVVADDVPSIVVPRYERFLSEGSRDVQQNTPEAVQRAETPGSARLLSTQVHVDGQLAEASPVVESGRSHLSVTVRLSSDPALPAPGVAITISTPDGQIVTSAGSWDDGVEVPRDARGEGEITLGFPALALLKGEYHLGVYLFCERGLHSYEWVDPLRGFRVEQTGVARGVVRLPHRWHTDGALS